jgi:hypothetical protein
MRKVLDLYNLIINNREKKHDTIPSLV